MEITGEQNNTQFNTNITTQWIPYWNGMLHLIGDVNKDHMIERTYDWDRVEKDCRTYAQNYLKDPDYCDRCAFSEIPPFLASKMESFSLFHDCKEIAGDNDILYTYCHRRQRMWRTIVFSMSAIVMLALLIWFVFFLRIWPVAAAGVVVVVKTT